VEQDRTPPNLTANAHQRRQRATPSGGSNASQKSNPWLIGLARPASGDRPFADLKEKRKGPATIQDGDRATAVRSLFSEAYFSVQTFMVFMPVSASVLDLNIPLSTTVVVVVVGFLSTTVHFLVVASRTT
jgi:hypothetical protein